MGGGVLVQILQSLVLSVPVLIVSGIGIFMGIVRWQELGRPAMFCVLGFGVILCVSLFMAAANRVLGVVLSESGLDGNSIMMAYMGLSFLWSAGVAVGYGLLIAAIFVKRPTQA
ncbi:MAG: hypothetical protein KJ052_18600 [Candidatus Hydrogenedentes bacterium]|nr:hypothetical protein [Candidatus Hydrogenedentota bacterium]